MVNESELSRVGQIRVGNKLGLPALAQTDHSVPCPTQFMMVLPSSDWAWHIEARLGYHDMDKHSDRSYFIVKCLALWGDRRLVHLYLNTVLGALENWHQFLYS